ncbi:unnamed protein product [Adineta ricciae]|uniref:Uncharacterized protein n=1 Tax=Adineta ricciae TaxID=249248 RepID=A0A815R6F1_ADIRI|nr:unnamed protein product [Adineta ricciae]CAF1472838.1 unnamed protein product [Adineta ricciae]
MTGSPRTSTGTFDGGGNSIVEQTADILTRFRNSLVRSRKERLLDEDVQATENLVNHIHLTELMAKETLGKLISQGDSMQRSYNLINQLEREIKDIAEDLNEVNGGRCWGACANGTFFGFTCLGCFKKKPRKRSKKKKLKIIEPNSHSPNQIRWSSTSERDEMIARTRQLARNRRQHQDFLQTITRINQTKQNQDETNAKQLSQFRDYLLQHHSLSYGYIDQPERLFNEVNMAIHFTQLNTHLDHLFQLTESMSNEVNKHNIVITKIEAQAMQSGDLLTDYTLLGHQILGSPVLHSQTSTNPLPISAGQKVLLNAVV